MVFVGPAACDAACTQQLYYMRQSRISLGKDQHRVERVWVVSDAATPDPVLLTAHVGLRVWRPDQAVFINQFPAVRPGAHHLYVVDPIGNLMMHFPENADPTSCTFIRLISLVILIYNQSKLKYFCIL